MRKGSSDRWLAWLAGASWTVALAGLIAGPQIAVNALSTIFVMAIAVAIGFVTLTMVGFFAWITWQDIIDDIRTDRRDGRPWVWRCVGLIGLIGLLVDGGAGAWEAYREHVTFGAAVEELPFSGVPLLMAMSSYPIKWIEHFFCRGKDASRFTNDDRP